MKRRDFLKTAAVAGSAASIAPLTFGTTEAATGRSKVVIVRDPQCLPTDATPDAIRIQTMVDQAIMTLTGLSDKAAAYRAIFPAAVSSSTKVVLKINQSVDTTSNRSFAAVYNAVKAGLATIGITNVTNLGTSNNAATSNPQFTIGISSFRIVDQIVACDYFINIPGCWATSTGMAGVTMTLKNMMGAVSGTRANMHAVFTSATTPALAIMNSQAMLKAKQVLNVIAAIQLRSDSGPGGNPNNRDHSIIVSRDMVAADYQGMLILKQYGLTADRETTAKTVFNLAAQAPYNLGNADPATVDAITISPPWNTQVILEGTASAEEAGLRIRSEGTGRLRTVRFEMGDRYASQPELTIFNARGETLWVTSSLVWSGETAGGGNAGRGMYFFSIKVKNRTVRGRIVF